tara:strand:+ start:667 stop:1944 length:1278 start_codon:yes stop_codon:yes gene_type:complete
MDNEKLMEEAKARLSMIRLGAFESHPAMATAIFRAKVFVVLDLKEKSGCSWCVDEFYRIYVDAKVLVGLGMETILESIASFLHEVQHPLRDHFTRFRGMKEADGSPLNMKNANIAADMAMNGNDPFLRDNLPKDCIFPQNFKNKRTGRPFRVGRTWEYYYERLDLPEENPPEEEGKEGEEGEEGGDFVGGKREWELGPPSEENPGVTPEESEEIQEATAREVQEAEKEKPGSQPADIVAWAGEVLTPPKLDWRDLLRQYVAESRDKTVGATDYSFSRTNRRMSAICSDFVLPSLYEPAIEPAVVIDSSGSMSDRDLKEIFAEVDGVLQTTASQMFVVTGDTQIRFADYVCSVSDVKIKGRGGTNMRPLLARAVEETPNCVIVLTDGYFSFPPEETMNGIPLIVCLVGDNSDHYCPKWVSVIKLEE